MKISKQYLFPLLCASVWLVVGCGDRLSKSDSKRGTPILRCDTLIYDKENNSFCLVLMADSTANAKCTYRLLMDNDSVLQENSEGKFCGIQPFDNGYDVVLEVEWPDTVIMRQLHVVGFVTPPEPVEQMTAQELQQLIVCKDPSLQRGTNEHLSQNVVVEVIGSRNPPKMLRNVILMLESGEWSSVKVTDVAYDADNRISHIILRPVGENPVDEDDEYYDGDFDM